MCVTTYHESSILFALKNIQAKQTRLKVANHCHTPLQGFFQCAVPGILFSDMAYNKPNLPYTGHVTLPRQHIPNLHRARRLKREMPQPAPWQCPLFPGCAISSAVG